MLAFPLMNKFFYGFLLLTQMQLEEVTCACNSVYEQVFYGLVLFYPKAVVFILSKM